LKERRRRSWATARMAIKREGGKINQLESGGGEKRSLLCNAGQVGGRHEMQKKEVAMGLLAGGLE